MVNQVTTRRHTVKNRTQNTLSERDVMLRKSAMSGNHQQHPVNSRDTPSGTESQVLLQ